MARKVEGIGVGLRREFAAQIAGTDRQVDWLEITPENWVTIGGRKRQLLDACRERFALVPHSVSLSIGGPDPLDDRFLDAMEALRLQTDTPWWSDHLCYSTVGGAYLHDLLPLPFSDEAVEHSARRIELVKQRVGAPFLLENATFYAHMPGGTMDEAEFFRRTLEAGDCGMLLDVNNVYVNSLNHGLDARAFIDRIPLERVQQLHVAGHTRQEDVVIDTHVGPIVDEVWALYRYAIARAGRLIPTLIEWDQDIPALDLILDEVDRARAHAKAALAEKAIPDAEFLNQRTLTSVNMATSVNASGASRNIGGSIRS